VTAVPPPVAGTDVIAAAFAGSGKRAALMPYLMGGFPTLDGSRAVGEAYAEAGADLVELGVPFSDPLADGPVIHAAATEALRAGANLHGVLEVGRGLAESVPVVLMCYANPIYARGPERFADELAARGISGLIVPDLPLEEAAGMRAACDAAGLALVPLVAPTTPDERLAAIGASARGFVYVVAVTGTTGERAGVDAGLAAMLERTRARTAVPVAMGFGIGTPEAAANAAAAGADGVIVGSRLVRAAAEADDPAAAVRGLVGKFAAALR
jgi:tryptophan synthase alpha chain